MGRPLATAPGGCGKCQGPCEKRRTSCFLFQRVKSGSWKTVSPDLPSPRAAESAPRDPWLEPEAPASARTAGVSAGSHSGQTTQSLSPPSPLSTRGPASLGSRAWAGWQPLLQPPEEWVPSVPPEALNLQWYVAPVPFSCGFSCHVYASLCAKCRTRSRAPRRASGGARSVLQATGGERQCRATGT